MTIPNPRNFCGGNFQDWLEVNLIEKCNAHCSWCIEKNGYHPSFHASTETIADAAIKTGKTNIILLGGEPLLYADIANLIRILLLNGRKVWITTNGLLLSERFVDNLAGVHGVNISVHSFDLQKNKEITGVLLNEARLKSAISALHERGASIRMNCNIIKGYIDTEESIKQYITWAKDIGANKVRFAELKQDKDNFVDLAKILSYKYGLNDDPFVYGCHSDCVIDDVPVNFRQMCGLQTSKRAAPKNPQQYAKEVLYYNGVIYNGWQTANKEKEMSKKETLESINTLTNNKLSEKEAKALLRLIEIKSESKNDKREATDDAGFGCQY